MSVIISFFAAGKPEPQGSTRAFVVKGRAVTTSDNPRLKDWRTVLGMTAREKFNFLIDPPADLDLVFVLPRTKAMKDRPAPPHSKKPDLDKLVRGALDAMTGVVFADDSHVNRIRAWKRYAAPNEQPGVLVSIQWDEAARQPAEALRRELGGT